MTARGQGDSRTFRDQWRRLSPSGEARGVRKAGETGAELAELIREIVLRRRRRASETSRRGRCERVGRKKAAALTRKHDLNARGRRKLL
jgi:hypothetical protein